ncbi:ATP-binding protein [Vibrio crassostreae]|nr:ATP-binding protein [Vibrio crassostreae]CAK2004432.1 ATP-binding protein [Vibrio crassostreae]CAK2007378.1 ATP-binding protein [Vibrio crassostreae]CAK2010335.1 ATP-binding protein [Vibrio crassostreae]CAK2014063.1 ATP-binding protein [Vibrio crassostreae]
MIDRRFPIVDGESPKLIGRLNILDNILNSLNKSVPDHLQVVGARFSGKTVLFNAVKSEIEQDDNSQYSAVLLWDLGHRTPQSDQEFLAQFSGLLADVLEEKHTVYAEHLRSSEETHYQDIAEVLEALNEETRILVIFDGFDKPLSSSHLTRNLWDQLRELAQNSSLRLITGSRKTLRELIRNPEAQTSDFWNIFLSSPVRVDCFDEDDIAQILVEYCGLEYEKGALTELYSNTNGNPILLLEVLNHLLNHSNDKKINNSVVKDAIDYAYESIESFIDALWHDCAPKTQELIHLVSESGEANNVNSNDKQSILEKGFARANGSKLLKPSRLLQRYLKNLDDEGGSLDRLFGSTEAYQANFNNVIAKRISLLPSLDPDLSRYLQRCVEDLPKHPEICLSSIRGIIDRSFELVWKAEFGGKAIPDGHFDIWRHNREPNEIQDFKTNFPQGAKRLRLLKLLTGSERSDSLARYASRSTYCAISSAYPFGDFGQHQEGEKVELALVYSAVLLCVELVASLSRDLSG